MSFSFFKYLMSLVFSNLSKASPTHEVSEMGLIFSEFKLFLGF